MDETNSHIITYRTLICGLRYIRLALYLKADILAGLTYTSLFICNNSVSCLFWSLSALFAQDRHEVRGCRPKSWAGDIQTVIGWLWECGNSSSFDLSILDIVLLFIFSVTTLVNEMFNEQEGSPGQLDHFYCWYWWLWSWHCDSADNNNGGDFVHGIKDVYLRFWHPLIGKLTG